ncbi:hypothetical protein R3X28_05890 [Maribacter sp. TH_r10]|uniref:Uncharacterized protein n=1 Tax=Maribacter luteus TaxID=2594478 RepID=A0A6I2MWB8_9FLAO|nr:MULTISPECIES: hypothetical protein [Maribacter]MDV7138395.1 hypothetical protein [Maribacter sp. TH_r10]MRX66226.1 hypothetical protein [Maribacter luteus]
MKYPLKTIAITFSSFFLFSCGGDKSKNKQIIQKTVKVVKETPKTNDFREHLKMTEPATETQFQNWLPTNLENFKRAEFTTSRISQNDIASAGAIYTDGDGKKLELTIVDGASKDGLLAINSHYMAQTMKFSSEKSSGYQKTYENKELKVLETYVEKDNYYEVKFLVDMRFGITIVSLGINHDKLWDVISTLDLKSLNAM